MNTPRTCDCERFQDLYFCTCSKSPNHFITTNEQIQLMNNDKKPSPFKTIWKGLVNVKNIITKSIKYN